MKEKIKNFAEEFFSKTEMNEPTPRHWKSKTFLFNLLLAIIFQIGLYTSSMLGVNPEDRNMLLIGISSMALTMALIKGCLITKKIYRNY